MLSYVNLDYRSTIFLYSEDTFVRGSTSVITRLQSNVSVKLNVELHQVDRLMSLFCHGKLQCCFIAYTFEPSEDWQTQFASDPTNCLRIIQIWPTDDLQQTPGTSLLSNLFIVYWQSLLVTTNNSLSVLQICQNPTKRATTSWFSHHGSIIMFVCITQSMIGTVLQISGQYPSEKISDVVIWTVL